MTDIKPELHTPQEDWSGPEKAKLAIASGCHASPRQPGAQAQGVAADRLRGY